MCNHGRDTASKVGGSHAEAGIAVENVDCCGGTDAIATRCIMYKPTTHLASRSAHCVTALGPPALATHADKALDPLALLVEVGAKHVLECWHLHSTRCPRGILPEALYIGRAQSWRQQHACKDRGTTAKRGGCRLGWGGWTGLTFIDFGYRHDNHHNSSG
jgi:hypothetical protein